MLDSIITSKTRLKLLVKFFIHAGNQGHLRGLATEFNESTNAIRKELNNLSEAGYLEKEQVQNRVRYKANIHHPLFGSLQDIVRKYVGLDEIVEKVVSRMGAVEQIAITGNYAEGKSAGPIEVVVVGKNLNTDYMDQLSQKASELLDRKVYLTTQVEHLEVGLIVYEGM
ncbi:helix-turn-helix domain-containing protein [Myroides guanonis]|uniref:PaaX-like protein n=1 Tax=Myroides guanonis TaxID=1150112 RepID=A0A1I3L0L8_9FLAO|nr:transcriptional regulator [Myroides guanonis]SFI78148.1 hypothetical protein SAMN04487893_101128 [Myroides guanonis]